MQRSRSSYMNENGSVLSSIAIDAQTLSENAIQGPLYKLKKNLLGQVFWSIEWFLTDGDELYHWKSQAHAKDHKHPSSTFKLKQCIISVSSSRSYAFKLIDRVRKVSIEFACRTSAEYEVWSSKISMADSTHVDEEGNAMPVKQLPANDNLLQLQSIEADEIASFFIKHDINSDIENPIVYLKDLTRLIEHIDSSINPNIVNYIKRDMELTDSTISYKCFSKWWLRFKSGILVHDDEADMNMESSIINGLLSDRNKTHKAYDKYIVRQKQRKEGIDTHTVKLKQNFRDSIHFTGVIDMKLVQDESNASDFLSAKMPLLTKVISEWPKSNEFTSDWNDIYQELLDYSLDVVDEEKFNTFNAKECYVLNAYIGHFYKYAEKGVMHIVDEYSLPTHMQTAKKFDLGEESNDEIYMYEDIVFRLIGTATKYEDREPSRERTEHITMHDDVKRKISGNDYRGQVALQNAIIRVVEHFNNIHADGFDSTVRPCTLLSTLVDYGGFRFQAQCYLPSGFDEAETLVYGIPTTIAADVTTTATSTAAVGNLFVDSSAIASSYLPYLADELNLSLTKKEYNVCTTRLSECVVADVTRCLISNIHDGLAFHAYADEREYILSFSNLIPSDMPRSETYDIYTRKLRPEFVYRYSDTLSSDALSTHASIDLEVYDNVSDTAKDRASTTPSQTTHDTFNNKVSTARRLNPTLSTCFAAWEHLYNVVIPGISSRLDNACFIPLDSYGLTRYLHNQGVCMRHMGLLYLLSKTPYIKQVLLCESIARSCKTLLNHSLAAIARSSNAEVVAAVNRKRSNDSDFKEYHASIVASRSDAIIDIFNLIFGYSVESTALWEGLLANAVFQKFGIDISAIAEVKRTISMPYLFLATSYHTGVLFNDHVNYQFNVEGIHSPFMVSDIVHVCIKSKCNAVHTGHMNKVRKLGDDLLGSEMYADATSVYRYELSTLLLSTTSSNSPVVAAAIGHTTYKLAVSLHMNNEHEKAAEEINQYLLVHPKYSAIASRMYQLLVSIQFKISNYKLAVSYFDASQYICLYIFGHFHPMHTLNFCMLADCYFDVAAYDKAMLLLKLALESITTVAGVDHIVTATIETKLSTLLVMQKKNYVEASKMLTHSALIYDALLNKGISVEVASTDCLYTLGSTAAHLGDDEFAINCLTHAIEIAALVYERIAPPPVVGSLILLGDLSLKKRDVRAALLFYFDAFTAVKCNIGDYDNIGVTLAKISCRMLSAQMMTLPLSARVLIHTISSEVSKGNSHGINMLGAFERTRDSVVDSLWSDRSDTYLAKVVKLYQEQEIQNHHEYRDNDSGGNSTELTLSNKLAISIAIINKLGEYSYDDNTNK